MVWLVIFVALLIPLTAVILDSPVVRSLMERRGAGDPAAPAEVKELGRKVVVLEEELDAVRGELAQLQDKHEFLQRLLEDPTKLPKPDR